jgi:hypothetical protein
MPNTLVLSSNKVDIYKYPTEIISPGLNGTEFTYGDLHSNAIKLVYYLILCGVLKIPEKHYTQLVEIYTTYIGLITKDHLNTFKSLINAAEVNVNVLVRLIGDEVADRGALDYYVLLILNKLVTSKAKIEILLSNHGAEFIRAYENGNTFSDSIFRRVTPEFGVSMLNLANLINLGKISQAEVTELIETAYKRPFLKLLSYNLNDNKDEITIFSHAGIGLNTIYYLTKKYHLEYDDSTTRKLAETIDVINDFVYSAIRENTFYNGLCNINVLNDAYNRKRIDPKSHPIEFILWNRFYTKLSRPSRLHGYKLIFVHGHDSNDYHLDHIFILNNILGKKINYETYHTGTHEVLYSKHVHSLKKHCLKEGESELSSSSHAFLPLYSPGTLIYVSLKDRLAQKANASEDGILNKPMELTLKPSS